MTSARPGVAPAAAVVAVAVGLTTACAPAPPRVERPVPVAVTVAGAQPTAAAPAGVGAAAIPAPATTVRAVPVVASYIPFGAAREQETAAYSWRHYGDRTWRLEPSMIVLHYTAGDSWQGARHTFAPDLVNLGELPGTCAHYVVDRDGTVHALVPVTTRCRHTIGLNDRAIGIEVVQPARADPEQADREILARAPQREALLALVRQLMAQHRIPATSVIGHAMANSDPHFRDLQGWRNDHVDWQQADVIALRAQL